MIRTLSQKSFWVAILSAIFLFAQNIAKAIGYDIQVYTEQLTDGLNAILGFLVLTGVIQESSTTRTSSSGLIGRPWQATISSSGSSSRV
ncbi:phage holin [Staphylococcus aureus]|uniref:phage holin n=1 Tax=Staphylococcus aureus TaxID=1280 RepID=UPI0020A3821E|nr:phage holin [Staphylococcus aureus]